MNRLNATSHTTMPGQCLDPRNPFVRPRAIRAMVLAHVRVAPKIKFDGKGFICALINSRCHVGCAYCMFASNMIEGKSVFNTMTPERVNKLMQLVRDSNTEYLLVSGGGEGFLEPSLMYQIVEESTADLTWMVTSAYWAKRESQAIDVLEKMYQAFLRGSTEKPSRRVCLRISVDSHHVNKLADDATDPLKYIVNVINLFESTYSNQSGFFLQLHSIEGEEVLIEQLRQRIFAVEVPNVSLIHKNEKTTESAIVLRMLSGYEFEVTFAKLLLSDIAVDLRDARLLEKRVKIWEKDAYVNENGTSACKDNPDGTIGNDMLVIYDGRVAGGWQSEMPDVEINIDEDSYDTIMNKTLSDPGVLVTIERGLAYRFGIIDEVCPKACIRSKAVNVRDYTSLVLLEEDTVKLYYTLRALQDLLAEGRIQPKEMDTWPSVLRTLVLAPKEELQYLYRTSNYDIVRQFEDTEPGFLAFIEMIRACAKTGNFEKVISIATEQTEKDLRRIDKWRLLLKRIVHEWYEIKSLSDEELATLKEVEQLIDSRLLQGLRIYEGLSRLQQA